MTEEWSLRPKATNAAMFQGLQRPLPPGVHLDLSFAEPLLDAYGPDEESELGRQCASTLEHYRLATVAAAAGVDADIATLAFDLPAVGAIRHIAASVAAGGRWLAEAFDLRLSRRIAPDPASKELLGRLAFADPALQRELQAQQAWLSAIRKLDRRLAVQPLTLRRAESADIPGPDGPAAADRALSDHLQQLDSYVRQVAAAAARQLALGPRPVREQPDEAWLND